MSDFDVFKKEFYQLTKVNLDLYKEEQLKRRLENFISKNKISEFKNFSDLTLKMKKSKELQDVIEEYITINVTEFLRNKNMWDILLNEMIPKISKNKTKIQIWSAACSTGEEPYTLAILMKEKFPKIDFEILATDLDKTVLEKAKNGVYKNQSLIPFENVVISKYFNKVDQNHSIVTSDIKKHIKFMKHNLLEDAFSNQKDLIICRNVLIYFKEETKEVIYERFNRSLNDEGILMIGSTEQIYKAENHNFKSIKPFFYQKM